MRPKKTRWITCEPSEKCFRPQCKPLHKLEGVSLAFDEFEAIRLADYQGFKQEVAARKMKISRPTFSRILKSAHHKVSDAFINIKAVRIEGGCCKITRRAR